MPPRVEEVIVVRKHRLQLGPAAVDLIRRGDLRALLSLEALVPKLTDIIYLMRTLPYGHQTTTSVLRSQGRGVIGCVFNHRPSPPLVESICP